MKKHFSSFNVFFNSVCVSTISLAMLLSLLAGLASCKNELLEPPDFSDRGTYSSTDISAPEVVVATQGSFRSITVSWSPVANAVKYEVYTSQISTVAFEKRTETNGNDKVSVVIREDADVLAYYKVKAYDKNGNASEFSKTCHGTTLGMPVITNIIQDEFGKSATVRWWCGAHFDANTYKNNVEYAVVLYADPEGTTQIAEQKMQGSSIKKNEDVSEGDGSAECTFTGLSPKTTYYYQVKAYLKDAPDKVEVSAIVDRETARRLIPNPVESLEATQGVSDKKVTLSFILPDFVDVKESSDVFLKKPLYFEISRAEVEYTASDEIDEETGRPIYKEEKKPLTDYTVIATIKSATSSEWGAAGSGVNTYYFDCTTAGDNTSSKKLTLEKTDSVQSNEGEAEPYIPGYKVTFTDTSAQRGDDKPPVYSYKITSYADISKKVTSDESVAKAIGWLIGNLKQDLSAKKIEYEYADEAKKEISKITVNFSWSIEDYGKGYTYIVTQSAVDTDENPIVDETIIKSMDINELKNFSVVYDLKNDKEGYYSYKFYIAPKGSANLSDAYYCYDKYRTKTAIVNSKDKLLEIEKFEVEDGYSDKFVIKWSYNPDFTYKLSWTPVVNDIDQELKSMALAEFNENNDEGVGVIKSISNGMATFEHEAKSGDVRKYTMQITSGFGIPNEFERPSYTLGTAVAKQVGYAYDTITIEWDKVQNADSYILDAWYEDGGIFAINTEIARGETSYTFTPDNYKDAKTAGKKMKVCITAKNAKTSASTKSEEIPARLLGPALINASVNSYENAAKEDSISLSWSAVEGAKGYLIGRVMYDAEQIAVEASSYITYYYDVSSGKIIVTKTDNELGGRANVEVNGTRFSLSDTYREAEDPNDPDIGGYQQAQAKIFWGKPFRYVVLPVLKEDDFDIAVKDNKFFSCDKYQNLDEMKTDATATCGYGLDVCAEKSKSRNTQKITWKKPFSSGNKRPRVFRRIAGTSSSFTLVEGSQLLAADDMTFEYNVDGDDTADKYEAYEYIVRYDTSSRDFSAPTSLEADFKETKDEDSETEQKNKGYLFCISDIDISSSLLSAVQGGVNTYAESVTWDTELKIWDCKKRALGPTGVKLYSMNNNIDGEWHPIAKIDSLDYTGDVEALGDDVFAEKGNDGISLYPNGIVNDSSGTTNGALKVLRDYKHYYALSLTRDDLETQMYTPGFGEFEKNSKNEDIPKVFAYRQITDEELVRAATLAMSIGFERAWSKHSADPWSRTKSDRNHSESSPGSGSIKYATKSTGSPPTKLDYNNLCVAITTKSKDIIASFITISGTVTGARDTLTDICPPYSYSGTLTVTSPVSIYNNASITFSTLKKSSGAIQITRNNISSSFGNITPLPFKNGTPSYSFEGHNDAEEWQ